MIIASLRNLRIGYRLALGFALMLLLMAIVTTMSLVLPSGPRNAVDKAVRLANQKSILITSMRQNIISQGLLAHDLAFPHNIDIDTPTKDMAQIRREQQDYQIAQSELRKLPLSTAELNIVGELKRQDEIIRTVLAEASEWVDEFNPGQAARVLAERLPGRNSRISNY